MSSELAILDQLLIRKVAINLEINFVDWPDDPEKPINDQVERVGEWIGQVRG